MPVLALWIPMVVQSISKLAFLPSQKVCKSCVTGLLNMTAATFELSETVPQSYIYQASYKRQTGRLPCRH